MIFEIPSHIIDHAKKYFTDRITSHGMKLSRTGKASLSFKKESPETYYVISGIVKEDRIYECQATYKHRLEGTEDGPLTSMCDCVLWKKQGHCVHIAAIFFQYHVQKYLDEKQTPQNRDQYYDPMVPPTPPLAGYCVSAYEYGTIIAGPHKFQGAPASPTYSSLKYLLSSHRMIDFPIPSDFSGKLIISLNETRIQDTNEAYPTLRFIFEKSSEEKIEQISIFENLYLFDWKNGISYHLPYELKELIQKIRLKNEIIEINELLSLATQARERNLVEVYLSNRPLQDFERVVPKPIVHIIPSEKKGQIDISIFFQNEEENIHYPIPKGLSSFTFNGGKLGTFYKKKDAYDFLQAISESLTTGHLTFAKHLLLIEGRSDWLQLIDFLISGQTSLAYDSKNSLVCEYNNSLILDLIASLWKHFGENVFRFSTFNHENRIVSFILPEEDLTKGIYPFYHSLESHKIKFYYQNSEIGKWRSGIRFERRPSYAGWFDLELNLSVHDLEIIQRAELEHNFSISSEGLVLLSPEQKELLKFFKRYTEQDGNAHLQNQDGSRKYILPFERTRIIELFELKKLGIEGALTPEEEAICHRLTTLEALPEYPIPEHLEKILRPYQRVGHHWLSFLYEHHLGACLADDMGLGKTLQTISFLESVYHKIKRVLIVCPVTILLNWEKEIKKFSNMDIYIYHGGMRTLPGDAKIILTSYGLMKREADEFLSHEEFDILILDEVQQLKNIRSLGAYAARKIKAKFKICLTGTPVENDLSEFYNIIDLCVPGVWGDMQLLRNGGKRQSRHIARKTAAPFILRRTKGQVLKDLPPKMENTVYLNFSDSERKDYLGHLVTVREKINQSSSKQKYGEILKGLLELRQKCLWQKRESDEGQEEGSPYFKVAMIESSKILFLVETLESIVEEGHQAIVFSQFTTYLDFIQTILAKRNWKLSRIDGSQTIKRRQQEVDTFQSGQSSVFLISLKAGGVGLNLTAASYVFIMDPWWNPAVENQAIDRAHRIGQLNTLTVYKTIIKESVEEKVLKLQEWKRELFKELLPEDDETLFTGKLSMKDFEMLLSTDSESVEL